MQSYESKRVTGSLPLVKGPWGLDESAVIFKLIQTLSQMWPTLLLFIDACQPCSEKDFSHVYARELLHIEDNAASWAWEVAT